MKVLSAHITDLCNSRCTFCVVGSPLYTKDTVDFDSILSFIRENSGGGFDALNLHGGEPTIHPRLFELLQIAKEVGYPGVHIQTNGIKMSDRDFVERAKTLGVSRFIVSLHASQGQVQDALTDTNGGWKRTLAGIRNAVSLGIEVRTNTVITRQNCDTLKDIAILACGLGVSHLNFSNIQPVGSAFLSFPKVAPTFAEMRAPLNSAIEYALAQKRTVTIEGFPYCTLPRWQALQLNEEQREIRMLIRGRIIDSYDGFMNSSSRNFGPPCSSCAAKSRCGGVYWEYSAYRGWTEFTPFSLDASDERSVDLERSECLK